jgi:hypothetical protein
MWRYLVGAVAALLLAGAVVLLFKGNAREPLLPAAPQALVEEQGGDEGSSIALPEASQKTREEKRFNRYDKDKNGAITREEYLASRRKAFARLDTDRDGRLSFDEWSVKTIQKFVAADADRSGAMNAKEFLTTAVKRTPHVAPKCVCPAAKEAEGDD